MFRDLICARRICRPRPAQKIDKPVICGMPVEFVGGALFDDTLPASLLCGGLISFDGADRSNLVG